MGVRTVTRGILHYVVDPAMLLPLAAYAWSRARGGYRRPAWLRLFIGVQVADLVQGLIFISIAKAHMNNQWFRHGVQPFIFAGLLWTLYRTSEGGERRRRLFLACLGAGGVAAVAGVFVNGLWWRNALFMTTQSLIYMGLGIHELQRLFQSQEDESPADQPEFWLSSALLIYGASALIFSATSNHFLRTLPGELVFIPWLVNGVIIVFYELALAKVFLCRTSTSS